MRKLITIIVLALASLAVSAQDLITLRDYTELTKVSKSFRVFQALESGTMQNGDKYADALAKDTYNDTVAFIFFLGENIVYDEMYIPSTSDYNFYLWGTYKYVTKNDNIRTVPAYLAISKKIVAGKDKINSWKSLLEYIYDGED